MNYIYDQFPTEPLSWLINMERAIFFYEDYHAKINFRKLAMEDKPKVAFILPAAGKLEMLLNLLPSFNILSAEIEIYCSRKFIRTIERYCNDHIKVFNVNQESVQIEANLLFTYGLSCIHFIKQKIPVIVLGPYGVGGLITPENFRFLNQNGFSGRPGGQLWEKIPGFIIWEEMLFAKVQTEMIFEKNSELAELLPYYPYSLKKEIVEKGRKKQTALKNRAARWSLVPVISSLFTFIEEFDYLFIRRRYLNDTVAVVNKDEFAFLEKISGDITFKDLFAYLEMSESDFWALMYSLLDQKILDLK